MSDEMKGYEFGCRVFALESDADVAAVAVRMVGSDVSVTVHDSDTDAVAERTLPRAVFLSVLERAGVVPKGPPEWDGVFRVARGAPAMDNGSFLRQQAEAMRGGPDSTLRHDFLLDRVAESQSEVARLRERLEKAEKDVREYNDLIGRVWDVLGFGWPAGLVEAVEALKKERDALKASASIVDVEKPEALAFHESAGMRLKSLAGEASKARTLTNEEFDTLSDRTWKTYSCAEGSHLTSIRVMLRWMEKEGLLSIRLPPQNQS